MWFIGNAFPADRRANWKRTSTTAIKEATLKVPVKSGLGGSFSTPGLFRCQSKSNISYGYNVSGMAHNECRRHSNFSAKHPTRCGRARNTRVWNEHILCRQTYLFIFVFRSSSSSSLSADGIIVVMNRLWFMHSVSSSAVNALRRGIGQRSVNFPRRESRLEGREWYAVKVSQRWLLQIACSTLFGMCIFSIWVFGHC